MITQYIRIREDELKVLRKLLVAEPNEAYDYADELADAAGDVPVERSRCVIIEQNWDALRFLLDREGTRPVCVIRGGTALTTDEWGHEAPRYLTPEEVTSAATHLRTTPFERLAEHFDPDAMAGIYPHNWSRFAGRRSYREVGLALLLRDYELLGAFFGHAAADHDGMIICLT